MVCIHSPLPFDVGLVESLSQKRKRPFRRVLMSLYISQRKYHVNKQNSRLVLLHVRFFVLRPYPGWLVAVAQPQRMEPELF